MTATKPKINPACMKCPFSQCNGICVCVSDPSNPVLFEQRAIEGVCPRGLFDESDSTPGILCRYRKEQIDEADCPTCDPTLSVKLKVFACEKHGRCTLGTKDVESAKSCQQCVDRKAPKKRIVIRHEQGLGDACCFTAAIRDLHIAFPNKYEVEVRTWAVDLLKHTPGIDRLRNDVPDQRIGNNIEEQRVEVYTNYYGDHLPHMLFGFHKRLGNIIGASIPVTEIGGDIRLSDEEKRWQAPWGDGPYWILNAGSKADFTVKQCDPAEIQKVVDHFAGKIKFVQIGGRGHYHPDIRGTFDLRGSTTDNDVRHALKAMYRADGVITPISFPMHLAAALETPPDMPKRRACIVLAGGRESTPFYQYPSHTVLHTIGQLDCCMSGGCWRYKVDVDCMTPVKGRPLHLAKCMTMLTADRIIESIERRYRDGRLITPLEVIADRAFTGTADHGGMESHDARAVALMAAQSRAKSAIVFGAGAELLASSGIEEIYHVTETASKAPGTIALDSLLGDAETRSRLRRHLGERRIDFALLNGPDRSEKSIMAQIETATTFLNDNAIICGTGYRDASVQKATTTAFDRRVKIDGAGIWYVRL